MDYADLRLSNGGNNKIWVPGAHRAVSGSLVLDGGAALKFDTVGSANSRRMIDVLGGIQLTSGTIATGDSVAVVLGPGAALTGETAGNDLTGTLMTSRVVGMAAESFGNLGCSLHSGPDDIGIVTVTRVTGVGGIAMVNGMPGIARSWKLESSAPPASGRGIDLSWHAGNDNGRDLSTAQVWTKGDGGAMWTQIGAASNASTTRTMSASTTAFGWFTIGTDAANTAVELENASDVPVSIMLRQNYPNPFNPTTVIGFQLPDAGEVDLRVYDVLGREIAILVHRMYSAGTHSVVFEASNLPSGIYLYRLKTGSTSLTRTMTLLR